MKHRIIKILVVLTMMFSFAGCKSETPSNTNTKDFDTFIEALPQKVLDGDDLDINYYFNEPEKYGIERKLYTLPGASVEACKKGFKEVKELLKELQAFDYDSLSESQQENYDVLKAYLENNLLTEDYIYFENNMLGSFLGYQAQLPLLLNEFTINDEQDLLSYFNILETTEEKFLSYVEVEKERQKQGLGMYQIIIDKVIEQCDNYVKGDHSDLIDQMNKKIDQADFLTKKQKTEYKKKNEDLVNNHFVKAYSTLKKELSKIDAPDKELGLASYKNGKEYYALLVKQTTGIDISVDDLKEYLNDKMSEARDEMISYISDHPSVYTMIYADETDNISYHNFTNANDTLEYLIDNYQKYFPKIDHVNYKFVQVPDSMKDSYSPAAYLTSKIDLKVDEKLTVILNGEYKDSIFSTIVHEGFPGHMYQDNYFKARNLPAFRYLLEHMGYCEGWAQYVENKSYLFAAEENQEMQEFMSYNSKYLYALLALMDLEIHYDGISRQEFITEIQKHFALDDDALSEQYDIIMETPANSLKYYVNSLYFEDYYNKAKDALGDKFDDVTFHKVILDIGPTTMDLVGKKVDQYIEEAK